MREVPVVDRVGAHEATRPGHGGPPRFFALFVAASGTMLAGTCERGIARRPAGDGSWTAVSASAEDGNVNAFASDADGTIFAAAGWSGVLASIDDGATWQRIGPDGGNAYAVASVSGQLIVGLDCGLRVRGADGSWSAPGTGPESTVYRLVPMADGRVLAGTEHEGVWIGDGGAWTRAGGTEWPVFSLAEAGGRLLAGTRGGAVMISADDGVTWRTSAEGLPDPLVHALAVGADGSVLAGTGRGIARSVDAGDHWHSIAPELAGHRIFSLAIDGATILAGSYEGVWASHGGAAWTAVDTGLSTGESFAVAGGPGGELFAGVSRGACRSVDDGLTWVGCASGIDADAVFHFCFTVAGEVLAGTDDGLRALDGASGTWQRAGLDGLRVYTMIEPETGVVLAGTLGNGVHRRDRDGTWRSANDGLPCRMAYDLLVSPRTGQLFVATGDVAGGEKTGGVFTSGDGGLSWTGPTHDPISVYRVVETSSGVLFGGAQRTCILRSDDAGETWETSRPAGLVDSKMYCMIADAEDRLFIGSGAQLLSSEDLGESWMIVGAGLDGVTVYALAATPSGTLVASTTSGMYRSTDHGLSFSPSPWPPPA